MKGIILAGGSGSRLHPLTAITNKHLLPVGPFPMIFYSISALKEAGVREILIVTGTNHMGDMVNLLGSGSSMGLEFTYKVQDQAGGIAEALGLARGFVGQDNMMVLLGDNIFGDPLGPIREAYEQSDARGWILLKTVEDPHRFGVATRDQTDRVIRIVEKPAQPETNLAVTGLYLYDASVFDFIRTLKPSARGELEITDVNNWYVEQDSMGSSELTGFWTDAGTHPSLVRAARLVPPLVPRVSQTLGINPVDYVPPEN